MASGWRDQRLYRPTNKMCAIEEDRNCIQFLINGSEVDGFFRFWWVVGVVEEGEIRRDDAERLSLGERERIS